MWAAPECLNRKGVVLKTGVFGLDKGKVMIVVLILMVKDMGGSCTIGGRVCVRAWLD